MKVQYLANEGFMITSQNKKILIDAIFGGEELGFCDVPTDQMIMKITNSESPFDNIDLITTSHIHLDHFKEDYVTKHLKNNKKGTFISTDQVINVLKEDIENYEMIKNKIFEVSLKIHCRQVIDFDEIEVTVISLGHGPYYLEDEVSGNIYNRHEGIQNYGFIFHLDGFKIFHSGDADFLDKEAYEKLCLHKENIDIAFLALDHADMNNRDKMDIIKNYISPKHIIIMHVDPSEVALCFKAAENISRDYESITVFKEPMEERLYFNAAK